MFTKLNFISKHGYSTYKRISNLSNTNIGEEINVKGWIRGLRKMKEHLFIDLNDGSSTSNLQVVVNKDSKLNYGVSIEATGTIGASPRGQLELRANKCVVVGSCPISEGYPFTPRQTYAPEYIRKHMHLRSQVLPFNSMLRVRNEAFKSINSYLQNNNYVNVHTPVITSNDCEGAGEIFRIQPDNNNLLKQMVKANVSQEFAFFDKKTFLTVSGQLHLESIANGLGNVYTFGPTFRAENSKSHVHLSEFYMLEVEKCFVNSITDITDFIEDFIKSITREILNNCENDIKNSYPDKNLNFNENYKWLENKFPILSFKETLEILKKNETQLKIKLNENEGLAKDHELFLVKYFNSPVFVIDWPSKMKPFYMKQKEDDSNTVEALDFLVPFVGELAGGSLREDNYELLKHKLPDKNLNWYLDLRKFGGIPTGGFGMGFERYLQFICNIVNIKDVIPFPRWAHNCDM